MHKWPREIQLDPWVSLSLRPEESGQSQERQSVAERPAEAASNRTSHSAPPVEYLPAEKQKC